MKKKRGKQMRKLNSKGITLVALVVTIVVLIILAGVTLASLTGEKGIIKEARTAKELAEKASLEEQVDLAIIKAEQKHRNPTIDDVIEEIKNNKVISNSDQVNKETGAIRTDLGYEITGKLDDYIGKTSTGDNEGNTSGGNGTTGGNTTGNNTGGGTTNPPEEKPSLPNTDNTKPFLPEDSDIISDSLNTGVIIKDKNNNEWVWIEVPKSIYNSTTTSTDYTAIETAMQNYASDYRVSGYTDIFYSTAQHGFANATEYNNHKNSMLKSVFENGGFYIGRYETGTRTARFSSSDSLTTPIIQRDAYPYTWVTCKQAQEKATEVATGGRTSSLMFGIQWDLVMKFIEEKGAKTQVELKTNSGSWGNYKDVTFEITRGLYTTAVTVSGSWNQATVANKYTKPTSTETVMTTGATDRNSVLGIYDLAGNVYEWTLEKASGTSLLVRRGGDSSSWGYNQPASHRYGNSLTNAYDDVGSRLVLW